MDPATLAALASAGGNILGSLTGGDTARRNAEMQQRAYQEMMARAKEGEGQFLGALNEPNQALEGYKQDVEGLANQNTGRMQGEINSQLSRAGVRGGQAANLYGRQIGELQQSGMRDINKLAYQDMADRQKEKQQYFANKGQSGFNLQPKYA